MAKMNQAGVGSTKGETHESIPKAAKSSDGGGEKHGAIKNGVGMGAADGGRATGGKERGEYNTGRSESVCYTHKKEGY